MGRSEAPLQPAPESRFVVVSMHFLAGTVLARLNPPPEIKQPTETDPEQAMRAMVTQATTIQSLATEYKLTLAASEFSRNLTKVSLGSETLTRAHAKVWAAPLLTFLKEDTGPRDAKAA